MSGTSCAGDSKPHPMPHCRVLPPGKLNDDFSRAISCLSWKFHDDSCNHFSILLHGNKHHHTAINTLQSYIVTQVTEKNLNNCSQDDVTKEKNNCNILPSMFNSIAWLYGIWIRNRSVKVSLQKSAKVSIKRTLEIWLTCSMYRRKKLKPRRIRIYII